ncbi:MAG: helix-turn-helix domain-containing protein [Clostridia bacterium]|nr:helix-turn-helix domain-containing protein [Clostridia bacterium]
MLNKNALRAEMVRHGLTQKQVAKAIGVSEKTFFLRMKSGVFGTDEVAKLIELLEIKDPMSIFFANEVT